MLAIDDVMTACGVMLGFQLTALTWRVDRELAIRKDGTEDKPAVNWLPPCDLLNIMAMALTVGAMLLGLSNWGECIALKLFRSGLLLFLGHPLAMLAHYRLGRPKVHDPTTETHTNRTEQVIVASTIFIAFAAFFLP